MKPYVFGVDIGGTTIKLGFFSTDGKLLDKWEIPTDKSENGKNILSDAAAAISNKMTERKITGAEVEGIGIGVPGPVDPAGVVHRCINIGWGIVDIKQELNRLLPDIPNVAAANDANVAALGELWQGGAKGCSSAVMITVGTGIGGGVVINGKIIAGANGGAGEIGHITVKPDETVACNCGKCGCLEQYTSANGIVFLAKRMLAESDKPSKLREMEKFTSREICDLAREGEEMAKDIIEQFGCYLGSAMSYVGCAVDPEVFIIGGGMSKAGSIVTDAVMKHYSKNVFHISANTKAVIATLGNDAGIYGCARMVLPEI